MKQKLLCALLTLAMVGTMPAAVMAEEAGTETKKGRSRISSAF